MTGTDGNQLEAKTDAAGKFRFNLNENTDYMFVASKSGYLKGIGKETTKGLTENTTLHIRNRYTVTYTYYTISNHATLNTNSSSENLYQGEAFTYPSQTDDYIDYKNSSNVLDYRLYYTFTGYANNTESCSTMPNHNYSLTSQYSTTRKNYYTISSKIPQIIT